MTIYCKICGQSIRSDKPDAQADVLMQMGTHLKQHQEQSIRLKESIVMATQLLATYLLIKLYVRIPPEEKELLETFDQNEAELITIFGLEPSEHVQEN